MPTPARRRSRKRSAFSTSERRTACQRSPMRTNGSFAAARSASSSSVSSVSPTASRQSNRASSFGESSPLDATRGALVAVRLTRTRVGERSHDAGQQHRDVALLEPRHRLAEEEPHLLLAELRLGRLGRVELDPDVGEHRLELAQLPDQVAARVAGAQEREDVVVAVPEQRRGQAERRIVARLQPQLEHEPRLVPGPDGGALVEMEAEPPLGSTSWSRAPRRPTRRACARAHRGRSGAAAPSRARSGPRAGGRSRSRGRPSTAPAARRSARRRSRAIWSTSTG